MYRALLAVAVTSVLAALLVSASVAAPQETRQRIAIEVRFSPLTGVGTWRVIPLTPGPIARGTGKIVSTDYVTGKGRRNGGEVTLIRGRQTLRGTQGTIRLTQRVESAEVQLGMAYSAEVGSWTFSSGTGSFAGFEGGGRIAGVSLPSGIVLGRHEGWVTRGQS